MMIRSRETHVPDILALVDTNEGAESMFSGIKTFLRDCRGQSGIEFALLLPIMVLLLAGTVDLGQGLIVKRKINKIAEISSDIVAQESLWTTQELANLMTGTSQVLQPFDTTGLTIQVAVIDVDSALNTRVNWAYAYQTTALAGGAAPPFAIPVDVEEAGVQLVVTQVGYVYKTPFSSLLTPFTGTTQYTFVGKAINRPRVGNTINKQ